ncbi:MAG: class I SAM-dependent methyltransferase [Deltaproteobacteria bacterium]|nr:class I SAM-dependent methyltransferase [Deltaproteobacteria bacterium]
MRLKNAINDYWESRAEGFSLKTGDDLASEEGIKWLERLRPLLPNAGPRGRALDVGCGPGFFSVLLAREGWEVTGLDYSEKMLEEARGNAAKAGVTVALVQGDAQEPPFGAGDFHLVISRNVTWTLEDPAKAYSSWRRLLGKGGVLINCDGNHYRHLYDGDYQAEKERPERCDDHHPRYIMGVDTNIMAGLARELPLSRLKRPDWDVGVLLDLGALSLDLRLERVGFVGPDGSGRDLIKDFIVRASF